MSDTGSATIAPKLADAIHARLQESPAPLKLAEVGKGLKKPKKMKKAEFEAEIQTILEEEVRLGRAFSYPSAKNRQMRWWARDEKQLLRDKTIELAREPRGIPALKKDLAREVKGVDGEFVEMVVRELIGEGRLFEHKPRTARGGPLFAVFAPPPPPPPLEEPKYQRSLTTLVKQCRTLLDKVKVPPEDLLTVLRRRLTPMASPETSRPVPQEVVGETVDELILKAVANEPVLSLADLRQEMPPEYQGGAFDEAVLRLADQHRVIIHQDADIARFSPEERALYVQDGDNLFTTIMKWS